MAITASASLQEQFFAFCLVMAKVVAGVQRDMECRQRQYLGLFLLLNDEGEGREGVSASLVELAGELDLICQQSAMGSLRRISGG